jgi:hypothetical protein
MSFNFGEFLYKNIEAHIKKYLCFYAKINKKKFLGDFGHIRRPLTYHGILRKENLPLIERLNYVREMVLKGSQKLHDLN